MPQHDMRKILKPGELGSAKLKHFSFLADVIEEGDLIPAGDYVSLLINGKLIMSNTPGEYSTNQEFMDNCYGDVFVAGLGIGMILMEVQDKQEVKSITVLEKNRDVIELVRPQRFFSMRSCRF